MSLRSGWSSRASQSVMLNARCHFIRTFSLASRPENKLAPIAVALIAEEVRARLIYLAGVASARRYEAISADARMRPIAEIARDLGISRQAVSRIVNQTRHERTLSDNNRLTGGAR